MELTAILCLQDGLNRPGGLPLERPLEKLRLLGLLAGRRQNRDRPADHLVRPIAEHSLGRGVPNRADAINRKSGNRLPGMLDNRS